ncbi:MAG: septum formation initiator family protein [Lachnospiraceae bacterium]|nr:septum formation initiator family protein [Lachnospiraceae bacterium]
MKRQRNTIKTFNLIFLIVILSYIIYIFVGQQQKLNSYKNSQVYYAKQIEEQKTYKNDLTEQKNNITSPEYIELIAREKLDMYLPNEKVYIDIGM